MQDNIEQDESRKRSTIVKYNNRKLYEICREQAYFGKEIDYMEFLRVIQAFNKKLLTLLVKGYAFESPIGKFFIARCKRNKPAINWNASFKRKQEIIDAGGIPYNMEKAPHGEKWFIYFTDMVSYPILWKRTYSYWSFSTSRELLKKIGAEILYGDIKEEVEEYAIK